MEPDPDSPPLSLVKVLWVVAFVALVVAVLAVR